MKRLFCLMLTSIAMILADDHPNFTGEWQLDARKSTDANKTSDGAHASNMVLSIQQDDSAIAMKSDEEGKPVEFRCATNGQNCKIKGESAEVSLYYNGPTLVELEMEGHNGEHVIKKRFHMDDGGKKLEMEVMRINPPGPAEKLVFTKK